VTAPRGEEEGSNAGSRGGSEAAKRADGAAKAQATAPPPAATHFQEISVTNVFDAAERVGVSLLANEATDKVPSEKAGLEKTVRKLSAMLDKTAAYVASVVDGKTEPNAEIGRFLADALASVPRLTQEQFEKVFGDAIQDVLLVMYLSNVTKMQLMLAEKLQTASLLV
jgi:translation initiation factor 3 subunit F